MFHDDMMWEASDFVIVIIEGQCRRLKFAQASLFHAIHLPRAMVAWLTHRLAASARDYFPQA